jgi:hypothetical protein
MKKLILTIMLSVLVATPVMAQKKIINSSEKRIKNDTIIDKPLTKPTKTSGIFHKGVFEKKLSSGAGK